MNIPPVLPAALDDVSVKDGLIALWCLVGWILLLTAAMMLVM